MSSHTRYASLSQWLTWLPEVTRILDARSLPPVVRGELDTALNIHGDNLLDIYHDELVAEVRDHYAIKDPLAAIELLMDLMVIPEGWRARAKEKILDTIKVYRSEG